MSENIEAILAEDCGLLPNKLVIVGVSGGPDSLCLLETLRRAGYPLLVAHFDHMLRPESATEGRLVEKTAARFGVASIIMAQDVRAYANEKKLSIEDAARTLRYRFLFDLARKHNAQAVAVGHTADDQVETVLMHFLRGSGLAGLKGMSHRSIIKTFDPEIPIVRPLLDMWREETVLYCSVHGLRPHYDSSNDSLNFQRNRIRHLLIPTLETYNPKLRETLLRMSHSLKGDHSFVMDMLEHAWSETVSHANSEMITFDLKRFAALPLGLRRNLIKHAMQSLHAGVETTYQTLSRAIDFASESSAALPHLDLKAGLRMFREEQALYICMPQVEPPYTRWPQLPEETSILIKLGETVTLAGGWRLTCEPWRHPVLAQEQAQVNEDLFQVWLDAETLPDVFEIRIRRQGDHFSPLGMDGHSQKLSDFFVNEKLPQRARAHWPLLCAGNEIIWIPGFRPAHSCRLKETTITAIYFSFQRTPNTA